MRPTDFPAPRQRYGEIKHCPRCGHPFRKEDFRATEVLFVCAPCGFDFYQNPAPAAVVVLTAPDDARAVLLLRRRTPPGIGKWCVPGGFIKYGEEPAHAARREVLEEVGVDCTIGGVVRAGLVDYNYRGRQICVVEISFFARLAGPMPQPGSDSAEASEIAFRTVEEVLGSPQILAFPEQEHVLRDYGASLT